MYPPILQFRRSAARRLPTPAVLILSCLILVSGYLTADEKAKAPIRLFGVDYLGDLPTLVAAEQGLFRNHGLDIQVQYSTSDKWNIKALRDGDADIALMATTPLVLDLLEMPPSGEGGDLLIIASMVYSSRLNHVVTLDAYGIEAPSGLAGRRIGLMKGTHADFLWWLFAALNRIEAETVSVIDIPVEELSESLISRDIDAAILWEPWISRLKGRLSDDPILLPGKDAYLEHWLLVTTRGLLQTHPDSIRALLSAYRDAIAVIETSPEQAVDLYVGHAGFEAQGLTISQTLPVFGMSLNWSLLTALIETTHWARESARVEIYQTPNPLSWIESGPLREILPLAVGIPALPANTRAIPR